MIFENGVYDLTSYISLHDRYLNIRSWCGTDMTEDFHSKDNLGIDHKNSSYILLEQYYIGELIIEDKMTENIVDNNAIDIGKESNNISSSNPYNLLVPLLLTLVLYWVPSFFIKNKKKFNAFWNTILLLTLLIPSFGFGVFMILRYQFPNLYNIDFKFMYWHVELSIVFSIIALNHLIQRFKVYLVQLKK
jgi:hypothetical protein